MTQTNSLSLSLVPNAEATIVDILAKFEGHEPVMQQVEFAKLPPASQDHIIRVGLTNILRDSMAGKASDPVEARQALVDKLQRVLSGDLSGASRGPRANPEERARNEYLDEVIAAHCRKNSIAVPKGKEAIAAARAKVYEGNKVKVDAEVKRRLRAASVEIDIDLA